MKLSKFVAGLAFAAGALAGQSALAVPIAITTADLTAAPFTNLDWADDGTAFTTGFAPCGFVGAPGGPTCTPASTFSLTYFAVNGAIKNTTNFSTLNTPQMDSGPNGIKDPGKTYEITTVATIMEQITGCTFNAGVTQCNFNILSGNFNVYYDTAANANNADGKGFGDGQLLISGTVNAGNGGAFTSDGIGGGTGSSALKGTVTFTQTNCALVACISPALTGSTLTTQLNFGDSRTASPAFGYAGVPFTAANQVFQADGNQSFVSAVPEPDSVALFGLGVGLLSLVLRRRKAA